MLKTGASQTISYVESKRPILMTFQIIDQDEILRSSVVQIRNERIYEQGWLFPTLEGVNDPRMGTTERDRLCLTCKGSNVDCPGHFGHIELAKPMYHMGYIDSLVKILRCVCFNCSKILQPRDKEQVDGIRRIRKGKQRFTQIQFYTNRHALKVCDGNYEGCGMRQPRFYQKGLGIEVEFQQDQKNDQCGSFMDTLGFIAADKVQTIWPEDVLRVLNNMPKDQLELLGFTKPQNMIMKRLLVAPPPVRPSVTMGSSMKCEDDLTYAYQMILKANNYMALQISKGANTTTINDLRRNLQFYVATLMDNQIPGQPCQRHKSGKPLKAISQRLKGKEGRVRGNLMGKRVDFSARTVITPDPNLELDQVGVPLSIALNLTIPVTVTPLNIDEMRTYVQNGPSKYPGAKYIIRHDEKQIDLSMLPNRSDAHLEYGYKVERHLMTGDYVVFNRQPSLHKMSTMGHRVRVLPYSTFRLNLSVTAPYNADFDGDEMNMFVPQSFESMAEVKEIMAVPYQMVSPQSNKPVMGIVQDSLLGIMLFTRRDNFVDKHTVMNLMMWLGAQNDKQIPTPAIIKPKPLWTGKQLLSLVIPNVNLIKFLDAAGKTPNSMWCSPNDTVVIISKGELISGNVNKATAGNSHQGLVHVIWRDQGPQYAKDFLSRAQNLINQWLATHGFTVGVQDVIASKKTMNSIIEKLRFYRKQVSKTIKKAENGRLKLQPGKNLLESLEYEVNGDLNKARDEAGQLAFKDLDPQNKIQNMVSAGSKGTNINISQIMGCVGQQNVEGKRITFGFNGRSLPHFTKYDYGPESKGFVQSNYMCGLAPSEFFFHAMGGREGIIDTAVKTSETGYIQRRLVKALEDVMVKYDFTVRNSNEQVIQFLYGEDGMAGEHIEDVKIDLLKMNNQEVEQKYAFMGSSKFNSSQMKDHCKKFLDEQVIDELIDNPSYQMKLANELKQIQKDRKDLREFIIKTNEEVIHMPVNINRLFMNSDREFNLNKSIPTRLSPVYVIEQVNKLINELTVYPGRTGQTSSDPLFDEANQNSTMLFKIYVRSELSTKRIIQQERMTQESFDWLVGEVKSRFEQSLVHPGEMIGSIAAHSIGEPATQMTLNTFHFAGVSSKNVTLGVPRLKEVINVAKTLKTPMISIYLNAIQKKSEANIMKIQSNIEHTTLADLLDTCQIYYDPDPSKTVIPEDENLIELYNEVPVNTGCMSAQEINSPWLLRFKLDSKKVLTRMIDMDLINRKLIDTFQDQINVMNSDSNDDNLVLRLRFKDLSDEWIPPDERAMRDDIDYYDTAVHFLRQIEDSVLHELTLKGIPEISKVYAKKYNETEYDAETGNTVTTQDNWMLETDGVALQKILCVEDVDHKKTISNDITEILRVLGIEAVRLSLINELRVVLNFYGIYVNYRHIATLCDVMCQRGRLTSITRHGINRLDSGPLRKCSFEETVDIFLEAAAFGEADHLNGVTESIMLGQTAPLGTGAFELAIDPEVLQNYAQQTLEDGMVSGDTPIYEDMCEGMVMPYMTDYASKTPEYLRGGQTSEYGRTPGGQSIYEAGFSPGHHLQSPSYASPNHYPMSPNSPNYRSPLYSGGIYGQRYQSPIYQAGFSSPIYQPGNDGIISPGKMSPGANIISGHQIGHSPNYSPNVTSSHVNSPYHADSNRGINYSPSYVASKMGGAHGISHSPVNSPSVMGNSPASPSYSPPPASVGMGSMHRSNANSPSYSPTTTRLGSMRPVGNMSHSSPNYSPTTPGNYHPSTSSVPGVSSSASYQVKQSYSPSYSPTTTPQFAQNNSPKYAITNRISPKYSIVGGGSSIGDPHYSGGNSSIGSPRLGGGHSSHEGQGNSQYDDSKGSSGMYIPTIPRYNPPPSASSPAYQVSKGGSSEYGSGNNSGGVYDPIRSSIKTDNENEPKNKEEDEN